jgi:hypothetical protein
MTKKIVYVIKATLELDPESETGEIPGLLDQLRGFGEAEIVDIYVRDTKEKK